MNVLFRRVAIAAVLLAAVNTTSIKGTPAQAADMARPVYKAPPVPVATYNWNGFYIGGNAGYGWAKFDRSGLSDPTGLGLLEALVLDNFNTRRFKDDAWLAGGQVGFNLQSGIWVAGVEADFNWTGLKQSVANEPLLLLGAGNVASASSSVDWFATLRGRLGVAVDRLFVYGTAGAAWADIGANVAINFLNGLQTGSVSKTVSGWAAGGGFEYGLTNNWSIKAEYLYVDLKDITFNTGAALFLGAPAPDSNTSIRQSNNLQFVRVGLNYKFDWGKTPVVAKY